MPRELHHSARQSHHHLNMDIENVVLSGKEATSDIHRRRKEAEAAADQREGGCPGATRVGCATRHLALGDQEPKWAQHRGGQQPRTARPDTRNPGPGRQARSLAAQLHAHGHGAQADTTRRVEASA